MPEPLSNAIDIIEQSIAQLIANVLKVQDEVLRTMKNRLTEEGFDIPYPIRTVYVHNQQ